MFFAQQTKKESKNLKHTYFGHQATFFGFVSTYQFLTKQREVISQFNLRMFKIGGGRKTGFFYE